MQNLPGALVKMWMWSEANRICRSAPRLEAEARRIWQGGDDACAGVDQVDGRIGDRVESRQRLSGALIGALALELCNELTGAEGAPSNSSEVVLDGTENNPSGLYSRPYDVHGVEALHHQEGVAYREDAIEDVEFVRASTLAEQQSRKRARCGEKPYFRGAAVAHGDATI